MVFRQEVDVFCFPRKLTVRGARPVLRILLSLLSLFAAQAQGQIISHVDERGKRVFINGDDPASRSALQGKGALRESRHVTLAGAEASRASKTPMHPPKVGLERMVSETAERHRIDPALVRAVIEAESNWNPWAVSRKGALGLMQLIPGTAERFGVGDAFNPEENIDGGVRYLRALLERYNGDLNKSLAAYNAGVSAVDRARGVPRYRETLHYVQKVTDFYFRPDSGRLPESWNASRPIYRITDERGRVIFTNE